jgi:hypothetical protein
MSSDSPRSNHDRARGSKGSFWVELWHRDLREFCLHFIGDVVKTLSILVSLEVFWEAIRLLKVRGYPEDFLRNLEKVHFAFMWMAIAVLGVAFVLQLVDRPGDCVTIR